MIKAIEQIEWYNVDQCIAYPKSLFIFGDNMVGRGKGGQAIIRDCDNAFGIPTKRLPSRFPDSYFSDKMDEWDAIMNRIQVLREISSEYDELIFPYDGLGTGLAEMDKRSPMHFIQMMDELNKEYGVYKRFI